jgi:phage terminase Nu1 subunit (DNA packaging protein)
MFDVGETLRDGLDEARSRLRDAQRTLARANSGVPAGRSVDGAMAETAQAALFTEALLSAEHARLAEIKAVVK